MRQSLLFIFVILLTGCSTTRHIPDDDFLYTGMSMKVISNKEAKSLNDIALEEIEGTLTMAPNNSVFGSGSLRWPIPLGLWMYNSLYNYKSGIGGWLKKKTAATPVLLSQVTTNVRVKTATNLLHEYGYFRGQVSQEVIKKNKKAKVNYTIILGHPFMIDSIKYTNFRSDIDSIINSDKKNILIHKGERFSINTLGRERDRITSLLRNNGYYYFRSDYIGFEADTINMPGKVRLRIYQKHGLSNAILKRWYPNKHSVYISNIEGNMANVQIDSVKYKDLEIYFAGKLLIKPKVLYRNFRIIQGKPYSSNREERTLTKYARLNTFKSTYLNFTPIDSVNKTNKMDVKLDAMLDQKYSAEFTFDFSAKSDDQIGPGATLTLSKKNVFHGGELLSLSLKGSYEWQTASGAKTNTSSQDKSLLNSWETSADLSLSFPRLLLPNEEQKERKRTPSTTIKLSFDRLSRAHYFRMISLGGDLTYLYQSSKIVQHTITPFSLTYTMLRAKTEAFDEIMAANPALSLSLSNQFIPAMKYTYTYDDTSVAEKKNHLWWNNTVESSGNIVSLVYRAFGKSFNQKKDILGNSFAQFVKVTSELRYNKKISHKENLVARLFGGVIYSYGNSTIAPYSEQFYIGGANSLRAFSIRSIGPGRYKPNADNLYSYMDQTGDIKLESNLEYRFDMFGNLKGALFTEAGNIWSMRDDATRPNSRLQLKYLPTDLAWDCGFGLRYDFSYLIIRIDAGYALHVPYETNTSGYFNMLHNFKDAIGIHFAIGYPF